MRVDRKGYSYLLPKEWDMLPLVWKGALLYWACLKVFDYGLEDYSVMGQYD
jgi:hypothetical protein